MSGCQSAVTHSIAAFRIANSGAVFRTLTSAVRLARPLLFPGQRSTVSSPRSESGGDGLPVNLPEHLGGGGNASLQPLLTAIMLESEEVALSVED